MRNFKKRLKELLYECRIYTVYNEIKEDMRKEF